MPDPKTKNHPKKDEKIIVAEIVSIGTELLLGDIINTNAVFISQKLAALGINCYYHSTVGDNPERINHTLTKALLRSDIVITSGGLGPTVDDVTVASIAETIKRPLVFDSKLLIPIRKYFQKRKVPMPNSVKKQSYIPKGSMTIENKFGTAAGLIMAYNSKLIIALPGPPSELVPMFTEKVMPYLKLKLGNIASLKTRTIKILGLSEGFINEQVKTLLKLKGKTRMGIYIKPGGEVNLKIMSKGSGKDNQINDIERVIIKKFGPNIYGFDNDEIEHVVGNLLRNRKKTIAIAESCTGGLISSMITDINGSSDYFLGSVVAYNNNIKINQLKVNAEILKKNGAVSCPVAKEMASNVKNMFKTDLSIAVTGIAGPTGGTKTKPVGLVFISVASNKTLCTKKFLFSGTRRDIKLKTAKAALFMLLQVLKGYGLFKLS